MTEAEDGAVDLVETLRERLSVVEQKVQSRRDAGARPPRVVALEWLDPPFAAGHWVPEQVRRAGGWEVLGADGDRSQQTTWDAVGEVDPEMLLLMPCGFHLPETLDAWEHTRRPPGYADLAAVRRGRVFALDGSAYFSRPGPRVIDGIEMLAEIFDPDAFVDVAPFGSWTPVAS
jgi:iron complex transport system substrate-binding protein